MDYRKIHGPMTPVSVLHCLLLWGPASRLRRRVVGQESVGLRGVLAGVSGLGRCLFVVSVRRCKTKTGRTELDDHLAAGDVAGAELEAIWDAAPATESDGVAVRRVGVLVF